MSTHIKWITAPILVVGLLIVADTPQAEAQGFSFGTRGLSIQVGQQSPSYHLRAPTCYYPGYNSYRYDYRSPVRRSYGYYPYRPTNIYRYGSLWWHPGVLQLSHPAALPLRSAPLKIPNKAISAIKKLRHVKPPKFGVAFLLRRPLEINL